MMIFLTLLSSLLLPSGLGQTTKWFQDTYRGGKRIAGEEPAAAGTYPVYIFVTGTKGHYNLPLERLYFHEMASRGYVSASIEYNNGAYPMSCEGMRKKVSNMFGPEMDTALSKVCARPKADCSKGVAVHGMSQGANLASMADQEDTRVTAHLLFGNGDMNGAFPCLRASYSKRRVGRTKRRSIIGGEDKFFGSLTGGFWGVNHQQQTTSGYKCWTRVCLKADGSGYYITSKSETRVDHCFMNKGGNCWGPPDEGFVTTKGHWGLKKNLDWLAWAARVTGSGRRRSTERVAERLAILHSEMDIPSTDE